MPTPSTRPVSGSTTSLVSPSLRPSVAARPDAAHGKSRDLHRLPGRRGGRLGEAAPGDLGIGEHDGGDDDVVERDGPAGDRFGHDLTLAHRAVGQHRLAGGVAHRPHVRVGGPAALVHLDEPRAR